MVNLFSPPTYMTVYAYCIDDSLPKFRPDQWVQRNRLYRLKHFCESFNHDGMAVTIEDREGNEINPSDSMSSFRSDRFEYFHIIMN